MLFKKSPVAEALDTLSPLFEENWGWDAIKTAMRAALRSGEKVIKEQLAKGRDPTEICLGAIAQYTKTQIIYGDGNFTYRGMLSMKGNHLHVAYNTAMTELHRRGDITEDILRDRMTELREIIKGMG